MHDSHQRAQLALKGWVAAGQIKLDPYLAGNFVQLVEAELKKAYRAGRHGLPTADAEPASSFRDGLLLAADLVDRVGQLPYESPVPQLMQALSKALRGKAAAS